MTTSHHTSDCTKMQNPQNCCRTKVLAFSTHSGIQKVHTQRSGVSVDDELQIMTISMKAIVTPIATWHPFTTAGESSRRCAGYAAGWAAAAASADPAGTDRRPTT